MKSAEVKRDRQILVRILFVAYGIIMLWLLFGQRIEDGKIQLAPDLSGENLNLIPFETVRLYWRMLQTGATEALLRHAVVNLAGNVIVFIPFGWFLPYIWQKLGSLFKTLLTAAFWICLVELCQYLTNLGSCDVDDLLLNLVGVLLGYWIWKLAKKK